MIRLLPEVASFTRTGRVSSCRLDGQWMNARASVELASSDTLIPSTCKADGTQERSFGLDVLFTSELVGSSTGLE